MTDLHVAVLDQFHPAIVEIIRKGLPHGWTVAFAASRSEADQRAAAAGADIIIVVGAPVSSLHFEVAPKLRIIHKLGAGVDNIDQELCRARGVALARLNGGNAVPVAEHTVMMMLAALRRLPVIDRRTRAGEWIKEEARGIHRQLSRRHVGLLGFGAIGRTVARMLSGFEVELSYYDPYRAPPEDEAAGGISYLPIDELLSRVDIISLHLPLLPETRNIINAERMARMKPGAIIINCARGGLVDEAALGDALRSGRLGGAGLDTFAKEPAAGNPLFELDNVVVTSHLAGATIDNFSAVFERGLDNIQRYLDAGTLAPKDAVHVPERMANAS